MDAPIETEYFDVVVLGTGVSESILAAALAKEGMSVLHLEPDDAYGDAWSSVAADDFVKWRGAEEEDGYVPPAITSQSYVCHVPARNRTSRVSVCETFGTSDLNVTAWVDLVPRPLMCAGAMVELLRRSACADYVDFKPLKGTYLDVGDDHGGMLRVPSSRSDVFQSRVITNPEKRLLMRFLKECTELDDLSRVSLDEGSDFEEWMISRQLNDRLRSIVRHTIVFLPDASKTLSVIEGIARVKRFMESLQRFGTGSAFLMTNYGGGEISQAFCRLCAVRGGVYVLRRGLRELNVEAGEVASVVTTAGDRIETKHVFASSMYDMDRLGVGEERVYRFAGMVRGRIFEDSVRAFAVIPAGAHGNESTVHIWQMDDSLGVCPPEFCVVHIECVGEDGGSRADVKCALRRMLGDTWSERIVTGTIFAQRMWKATQQRETAPRNLHWIYDQDLEIDFSRVIAEAEENFHKIFPDRDWFPTEAGEDDRVGYGSFTEGTDDDRRVDSHAPRENGEETQADV